MAQYASPIIELIRQDILTTLAGVSVSSGYNVTLTIEEPDRVGNPVGDGVAIVMLGETHLVNDADCQMIEWDQEFLILIYVVQPGGSTAPYDREIALARSDAEKALMKDPFRGTTNQTQNGATATLAIDTKILSPQWFHRATGTHEGIICRCQCKYRTDIGDPYIRR